MSSLGSVNNNAYTQLQPQEVTAEPRIQTVSGNHPPNVVARIAAIPVVSLLLDFLADNAYTCRPYALVKRVSSTVNTLTKPIQIVLSPMIAHMNDIANLAVDALLARCPVLLLPQPGDVTTNVQHEDSMGDVPAEVTAQVSGDVTMQAPVNVTLRVPVDDTLQVPSDDTLRVPIDDTLLVAGDDTLQVPVNIPLQAPSDDTLQVPVDISLQVRSRVPVDDTLRVPIDDTLLVAGDDTLQVPVNVPLQAPSDDTPQVPVDISLQVPTNSTLSSSSLCMSESALLSSAAVQWMRIEDGPHRVINSIHHQLTAFEGSSREMFRENFVLDATTNSHVPHLYQRLVRLTEDAPHDVFQRGFLPVYTDEDLANDTAFNLEEFLHLASRDKPRIFVSTTRPSRVDGRLHVSKLQTFAGTIFEYEIYARGGIDVNRVIPDNQFLTEQEIAFPGGICRESIRLASERHYGELVAVPNPPKPKIRDNVKQHHWAPTA